MKPQRNTKILPLCIFAFFVVPKGNMRMRHASEPRPLTILKTQRERFELFARGNGLKVNQPSLARGEKCSNRSHVGGAVLRWNSRFGSPFPIAFRAPRMRVSAYSVVKKAPPLREDSLYS